jgi:AraC family transcriptional regulator of adaptative response / DNA-3-methyladenine glycosylase II
MPTQSFHRLSSSPSPPHQEHDAAPVQLDRTVCYRVLRARDARFDGRFYVAVTSTGIFCRPICPARTPKLENCIFLPSAAAAHRLGFRSCLRCRPELAPGVAGWRGSASTVSRALSLIAEGALHDDGVDELAARLGVGARHLRRLFDQHVGASPICVAQAQRILFAKRMLDHSSLSMTQIALASGFGSVRRFNAVFLSTYGRAPSALRRARALRPEAGPGLTLKLPFTPPFDWRAMLEFLAARAIPEVELVEPDRYRRTFALGAALGTLEVSAARGENALLARIRTSDVKVLGAIAVRLRRMFDLDADSGSIDAQLARDPSLGWRVRARPGLRVPGAWDGFELAVRAVLGQQISVKAATTLAGRIAALLGTPLASSEHAAGEPRLLFPTPAAIAAADLTSIGLTRARAASLNALGAAIAGDQQLLCAQPTLSASVATLCTLPGVGPWTAHYIAMRALREPDAFPASDLGLLRALSRPDERATPGMLERRAEPWRPWRAYAALRLWTQTASAAGG